MLGKIQSKHNDIHKATFHCSIYSILSSCSWEPCQIIIIVFETDCIEPKSGWSRKTSETAVAHDGCNDLTCTTTAWFKYRYISIWYFILYARFLSVLARSVTISHIEQLCNTRPHDCTVHVCSMYNTWIIHLFSLNFMAKLVRFMLC